MASDIATCGTSDCNRLMASAAKSPRRQDGKPQESRRTQAIGPAKTE